MVRRMLLDSRKSLILSLRSMSSQIRNKRRQTDAENTEKLARDVAVERAAQGVDQAGERGQEAQRGEHARPRLVGLDVGVREADELLGHRAGFRGHQPARRSPTPMAASARMSKKRAEWRRRNRMGELVPRRLAAGGAGVSSVLWGGLKLRLGSGANAGVRWAGDDFPDGWPADARVLRRGARGVFARRASSRSRAISNTGRNSRNWRWRWPRR